MLKKEFLRLASAMGVLSVECVSPVGTESWLNDPFVGGNGSGQLTRYQDKNHDEKTN